MSWNYRVMRIDDGSESTYGVHEVYYDEEGVPRLYSKNPCPVYGESIQTLQEEIERFRRALEKPVLTPKEILGDLLPQTGDEE